MVKSAEKHITLSEESYWKLIEIKTSLRCKTWEELADRLHTKLYETAKKTGKIDF